MSAFDPCDALQFDIQVSTACGLAADPLKVSERLQRVKHALAAGHVRDAIESLLRLAALEGLDAGTAARCALMLANSYARLAYPEDANEWLLAAQRHMHGLEDRDVAAAFDVSHAAVLHWCGHEVHAIRAANAALAKHARRAHDPQRRVLLQTLGSAYLRLGQIVKAEQCAQAILNSPSEPRAAPDGSALLLLGEIKLWSLVRQHPSFRGHVLVSDELSTQPAQRDMLVDAALAAFRGAFEVASVESLVSRDAMAGLAMARLARRPESSDWAVLENYVRWTTSQGLIYERDLMRLHLGVLLLLHGRAQQARRWLMPLANAALHREGLPLEHDALFFASVACGESGNERLALDYLRRFNGRIRDQHLARGTVPPPCIAQTTPKEEDRGLLRRRGETDRGMVDRVVERLRAAPSSHFSSEHLAQLFGVSRRTLENGFRRITGFAPKEFTTRLRLAEFNRRLKAAGSSTPADLDVLARSVGFSSYRACLRCEQRQPPGVEDAEFY